MTLYGTLKSFKCNYVNDCYGGLVVCPGKDKPASSEHCKHLKKLLMLMSGFVSLLAFKPTPSFIFSREGQ